MKKRTTSMSILDLDWFWCYMIPYLLDVDFDYEEEAPQQDKLSLFGSSSVSESTIFNEDARAFFINEMGNEYFIDFRQLTEIAFPQNRVPMLCEHLETKLFFLYRNLKNITKVCLMINKNTSHNFKQALSYDWQNHSSPNNLSPLRKIVQLMDSYYGILKWGAYWTSNLEESFTESIFPKILYDTRNRLVDELVLNSFNRTIEFEHSIELLEIYNKELQLLKSRKKYICSIRPRMLNTFQIYPWNMIVEPSIRLRTLDRNRKIALDIVEANWSQVDGLNILCFAYIAKDR